MYLWGDCTNTQAKIQMLKIKQVELWQTLVWIQKHHQTKVQGP